MQYPKLRKIEIFPLQSEGQRMICLNDPSGLADESLMMSQDAIFLLSLLDGQHSVVDIQAEYMRRSGELIFSDQIEAIIQELNEHLFLENEKFQNYYDNLLKSFSDSPIRKAFFAGKGYPQEPDSLRAQIKQFFTSPSGPGAPESRRHSQSENLCGIIAPHIDLQRGGSCFAWAYKEIFEKTDANLFVIFGTAHQPCKNPFALTFKDFETPFGILETSKDLVQKIKEEFGAAYFEDEFVHRSEHSIEFQTVFLHYLYQGQKRIKAIPILCGSFNGIKQPGAQSYSMKHIERFLKFLQLILKESNEKICFIAGADLSHVGVRFGDPPLTRGSLQAIKEQDLEMLSIIEDYNVQGFLNNIAQCGDRRKICGVSPIFALLQVIEASEGKLLKYEQAVDARMSSVVSFASLAFYR